MGKTKSMKFYKITQLIDYPVGLNTHRNNQVIKEMANKLQEVYPNCNFNFWCRGSSGAIIAGVLCYLIPTKTHINHIKKQGEESHSKQVHNVIEPNTINIIVDDLVASGKTVKEILVAMSLYYIKPDAVCFTGSLYDLFPEIDTYFCQYITINCGNTIINSDCEF